MTLIFNIFHRNHCGICWIIWQAKTSTKKEIRTKYWDCPILLSLNRNLPIVEPCLKSCQTFKIELFAKIVNDWKQLTISRKKKSILHIWLGSKSVSNVYDTVFISRFKWYSVKFARRTQDELIFYKNCSKVSMLNPSRPLHETSRVKLNVSHSRPNLGREERKN